MKACKTLEDPFETRKANFAPQFQMVAKNLATWRKERLAPPHALQSDFDRAAATGKPAQCARLRVTDPYPGMQMLMGGIAISSAYIFMPYLEKLL
jgi:hypothetical protein